MADNFVTAEVTIPHDGNWIMKIDPPNIFSTRQGVTAAIPSPGAELYVKADIYIPSSAEGFFPGYTDVLCIQDEVTGAHNSWQALTLHTSVGILYF